MQVTDGAQGQLTGPELRLQILAAKLGRDWHSGVTHGKGWVKPVSAE